MFFLRDTASLAHFPRHGVIGHFDVSIVAEASVDGHWPYTLQALQIL